MNDTARTRSADGLRFDLMVELRSIAGDIRERFGPGEAGDLEGRLIRATDRIDALIKELLYEEPAS